MDSLNNCINELQQHAYARRLDLESAHHGYVESPREQVRLQEELVMKDKVLRETQIRNMHEKFSVQKLRESHETIQRLTSQAQEIQERMNYLNNFGEFQKVESNYYGIFHTFPVNQQGFQFRDPCWAATNACHLSHGIHPDYRKSFLQTHARRSSHHKYLSRNSSICDTKYYR